jgi:hypothetical protein
MFKNFLMKKLIKSKLKGLPDEQVDMIINMEIFDSIKDLHIWHNEHYPCPPSVPGRRRL